VPAPVARIPGCGHLSDPHLEGEFFVYKWQVFLGGIASATFVLAGAAAPAQAQTTAPTASTPAGAIPMTTALPGLSAVTGVIPGLGSISTALAGLNSAAAQAPAPGSSLVSVPKAAPLALRVPGASVPGLSSNKPGSGSSATQITQNAQNTLNGVAGTLPVSSLTGGLPNLGNVTGALSGVTGPRL
jgi:hypothetical protein